MVADNDQELRARRLWDDIAGYLTRGNRDAKQVADVLQFIKDDPNYLAKLFPTDHSAEAQLDESQLKELCRFWKAAYGLKLDISNIRIPEAQGDINQILVMPKGLTLPRIVEATRRTLGRHDAVKVWIDLSKVTNDRNTDRTYAIRIRDRQEADEELKNLSAEDIEQKNINTMTLPERLVYEQFCFWKTGLHLDVKNATLCCASRWVGEDGGVRVPGVSRDPGLDWVYVNWGYLGGRNECWRARQAVS